MRIIISCLWMVAAFAAYPQRYQEQLTFSASGNQTMNLGRYQIGTAIRIEAQISGGWAQDGGIYHLVSDWGNLPVVALRSESDISDRLKFYGYLDTNGYAYLFATWWNQSPQGGQNNQVKFTLYSEGQIDISLVGDFTNATPLETILTMNSGNKNVGIGTTDPTAKLSVNGTIRSREIICEVSPWPDYVFEEDYELQSLSDLKAFIQKEGHLPGIPTAKEVEENGVTLAKMNALLLEKIEELTLHIIRLEERIDNNDQKH